MAKLTKPLLGAAHPGIYFRECAAGEDCPPELEAAARENGALEEARTTKARKGAPDNKAT